MNGSLSSSALSPVLIALMKGVTYQEDNITLWQSLLSLQARAREYLELLGLELILDEAEGYAFLRQRIIVEGEEDLARLVPRRQLGYSVSLLLALLRKKLAEFDATSSETRLILRQEDIVNLLSVFMPETANEARLMDRIESDIKKIVEMGFLRRLKGHEDEYEVRRIVKAFVDAQWLSEFDRRLAEYREIMAGGTSIAEKGAN
jgi:Domain of unknown function (DUF4194)